MLYPHLCFLSPIVRQNVDRLANIKREQVCSSPHISRLSNPELKLFPLLLQAHSSILHFYPEPRIYQKSTPVFPPRILFISASFVFEC